MNIDYLIQLLTNRLNGLTLAKDQAFQSGDLERIVAVDAEILDVQNTVSKLKLLSSIEETAVNTPFSEADVVKKGIEAAFNPTTITDATKCLLEYDITSYAVDPDHEKKIQSILEKMGTMSSAEEIEQYVRFTAVESPLTGQMIFDSGVKYNIDVRLMMALIELDSVFGTLGIGAKTNNPGNVGNNGVDTRTYPSWSDGVDAVADWLNDHRVNIVSPPISHDEPSDSPVTNSEVPKEAPVVPIVEPEPDESTPVPEPELPTSSIEVIPIAPVQDPSINMVKPKPKKKLP
ncbi:glucosaminidase domain-containing protein [Candidatus Nomurabacteria bacterium]|jgi:hypothetical protein|nr:MAG: glucosaminidase domain-containing protein [Candidatus Nomurabacteria bacterium]